MEVAWLAFNAILYLALGAWCTFDASGTSEAIGYALTNGSARSEYLTVYGGLEFGMAAFLALCAWKPELRQAGLLFGVASYGGIVLMRAISVLRIEDVGWFPKSMLPFEALLLASAVVLLVRRG